MNGTPDKAIFRITSVDQNDKCFGTGFVIKYEGNIAYILTCAHVVRDVGGKDNAIMVNGLEAEVYRNGEAQGIDLAVLKIDNFPPPCTALALQKSGRPNMNFSVQVNSVAEDYEYDFFLSYLDDGDMLASWVTECFLSLFKVCAQDKLGYEPKIYLAKHGESVISSSYLRTLLASKCVIPLWCPAYLNLAWSLYEYEALKKVREPHRPEQFIFPVVISNGHTFSRYGFTNSIANRLICNGYVYLPASLKTSIRYMDLQDHICAWMKETLSKAVNSVPAWHSGWLDEGEQLAGEITPPAIKQQFFSPDLT